MKCRTAAAAGLLLGAWAGALQGETPRRPAGDVELRYWLENMVWHHRFDADEVRAAAGLSKVELDAALARFDISPATRPARKDSDRLLVLPYPGGRHPRIGFLDGAVDPQRETKASVFAPWDPSSYVVIDVPEAIWSDLGLTYLAHKHIDTIWTERGIDLPRAEWSRGEGGRLTMQRELPNGLRIGADLQPGSNSVVMELWLHNGTPEKRTGLRAQVCVMLKGAKGFEAQTGENKILRAPFVACRSADGKRWIITAWRPCHRPWQNPPVPCLHSDPKFPDCAPGETVRARGQLWFYEGDDIHEELERLAKD